MYGKEAKKNDKNGEIVYGEKMAIFVLIDREYLHYMGIIENPEVIHREFEIVCKKNYFYRDYPIDLELLKSHKQNIKGAIKTFREFTTLVEQFIITKKIKGPGIISISDVWKVDMEYITKIDNISFISHSEYPPLIIGTVHVRDNFLKINMYKLENKEHGFLKTVNYTDIKHEKIDVLVHHNLHIKNIGGVWTIDIFECAKQLIRGRSFSLDEILKRCQKNEQPGEDTIETVRKRQTTDPILIALLKLSVLELCKELCEVTGHQLNRTISFRAERTEYFLMHAMYSNNWLICKEKKENEHYTGGLVLDPRTGLFEKVILIDFNSLYPSIIIESNLCFSTIHQIKKNIEDGLPLPTGGNKNDTNTVEAALLPKLLGTLIARRRMLKKDLKKKYSSVYDARQKALKITANSIYGCLGSTGRFSNLDMAAFITRRGRELLLRAKAEIETMGLSVLYGDTDSLMIHVSCEAEKIPVLSQTICENINRHFRFITIEMEDIFEKVVLYTKKKYAGITTKKEIVLKGIERRDFCVLSNQFIYDIISIILTSGDQKKIIEKIIDIKNNLKTYDKENFVLQRILGKDPEKYTSPAGSPHILLALRVNERIRKKQLKTPLFKKNDVISYLIGRNGAFLPSENFEIDFDYYVKQQILSPLFKITNVLGNFNVDAIRKLFNIQKAVSSHMHITTPCCETVQLQTSTCNTCNKPIDKNFLHNKAMKMLREEIELLYEREFVCDICDNKQYVCLNCFNCGAILSYTARNKEFDNFLEKYKTTFPDFDVDDIAKMSGYRQIDLSMYFLEEINRCRRR